MGHERIRQLLVDTFPSPEAAGRTSVPEGKKGPYLRIHCFSVFVRDMERSLDFYLNRLGFRELSDSTEEMSRCVTVAPPDGTAILALVAPTPESDEYALIGKCRFTVLVTDDVVAKFDEWSARGVWFPHPPLRESWGGVVTGFVDLDGNRFTLVGFDPANEEIGAHRTAAHELEYARDVQAKLFPQIMPPVKTLDYAGACLPARHVGGDYYDFLDLGRGRIGLVLADICGKGIAAALMMSNLQAHVRNLCESYSSRPFVPLAAPQPQRFLETVNRLFFGTTAAEAYATLIFVEYDDAERRLRYANCGHLAALLFRSDGAVERLPSTCGVLGLFKNWECVAGERQVLPGDTLCLYTDGVTESFDDTGGEFGEDRLIASLRRHRPAPAEAIVQSAIEEVQSFSARERHDDITLIVAKCR